MGINTPKTPIKSKKWSLIAQIWLEKFFDHKTQLLDVAQAWNSGMVDELRGLCIKIFGNKEKYFNDYRDAFAQELQPLIELFGLYYINNNQKTIQLESLLESIKKDIFAMGHKTSYIDKEYMVGHIGKFLDTNKDTLMKLGIAADGGLIKSLYSSYVNNRKVDLDERRKRYNRLLFAYQLEQPIAAHIRARTAHVDSIRAHVNERIATTIQTVWLEQKDLLTRTINLGNVGSFDVHTDVIHNQADNTFVFPHQQKVLHYTFSQGIWTLTLSHINQDNKKWEEISVHTVQEKSDFYVFLRECVYTHLM